MEFKLNVPIEIFSYVNHLNVEQPKRIIGFTNTEGQLFVLRKQNRVKHPYLRGKLLETSSFFEQSKIKDFNQKKHALKLKVEVF